MQGFLHGDGQISEQLIWHMIRTGCFSKFCVAETLVKGGLVLIVIIQVDESIVLLANVRLQAEGVRSVNCCPSFKDMFLVSHQAGNVETDEKDDGNVVGDPHE